MKNKKNILLSLFVAGVLILSPMYIFVGCGNKQTDTQTSELAKNTETKVKENSNNDKQNGETKNINTNKDTIKESNKEIKGEEEKKVVTAKEENKNIKSENQITKKKEESKTSTSKMTSKDAISICEKKYGKDSDTIYSCSENIKDVNGEKGYLVQVKSKELMKQGGNGVAFTVLVTTSGKVIEL